MLGGSVPILVVGVHFTAGMLQSNNLVIADNNINASMTSTSTLVFSSPKSTWSRSSTILEWPLLLAPIRAVAPPGPFLMRKKIRLRIRRGCFSGWSQMVTIKQNWPWKKCFRRTFSNYDMNARNRVQLLIKFQYHWHNSFMCFLQYLLFTSISGCCNKSFTMNMCPPEQKSLQRVCLFVCLFVYPLQPGRVPSSHAFL